MPAATDDPGAGPPGGTPLDSRMRASIVSVAATGLVFTLGAFALAGPGVALSVGIGAAVAAGNLWALARIIAGLMPPDGGEGAPPHQTTFVFLALLKMLGLVGLVWLLMEYGLVSPIPMVVGVGSLPVGIAIGSLVSDRRDAKKSAARPEGERPRTEKSAARPEGERPRTKP